MPGPNSGAASDTAGTPGGADGLGGEGEGGANGGRAGGANGAGGEGEGEEDPNGPGAKENDPAGGNHPEDCTPKCEPGPATKCVRCNMKGGPESNMEKGAREAGKNAGENGEDEEVPQGDLGDEQPNGMPDPTAG